tara:strand:- start:4850 stop:5167 length:318 start_codon:yes stop_codon:yes gene_type:complete
MDGCEAAHRHWEQYSDYIEEQYMDDCGWECFKEEAAEHEDFTNEDGEWLPEYDTDEKLYNSDVCREYISAFISTLTEIQDDCRFLEVNCGGCLYSYYGVSRSDFA